MNQRGYRGGQPAPHCSANPPLRLRLICARILAVQVLQAWLLVHAPAEGAGRSAGAHAQQLGHVVLLGARGAASLRLPDCCSDVARHGRLSSGTLSCAPALPTLPLQDFTICLDLPSCPAEKRFQALLFRGMIKRDLGALQAGCWTGSFWVLRTVCE